MRIDLHTHTTFSDGTLTPDELVSEAIKHDITALAVTDHDTLLGIGPTLDAAGKKPVTIVPGVELSIDMELRNGGYIHLLGLFIDHRDKTLTGRLATLRQARDERNQKILKKLNDLNIKISADELDRQAGKGSAGRPHIAELMRQKGYVENLKEAFTRYLAEGAPAHVDREKLGFRDACTLIHQAGGLAILAHPVSLNITDELELERMLLKLRSLGMDGLEVYSSFHRRNFSERLLIMAEVHGLLISGGSDFHGTNKPDIRLGLGLGNLNIPVKIFTDLQKAAQERYRS
jgi:hypothetical protein